MTRSAPNGNGFEGDVALFEYLANHAQPKTDRSVYAQVASTYRKLVDQQRSFRDRQEQWAQRAGMCRLLAERFKSPPCQDYLLRLADTYDILAGTTPLEWDRR
jgi:hypothetical protein